MLRLLLRTPYHYIAMSSTTSTLSSANYEVELARILGSLTAYMDHV